MQYTIICDVVNSSDITLSSTNSVVCNGSLQVIEYSPSLGDLSPTQLTDLFGYTVWILSFAFLFRFVHDFILNKR